jgi:hypothetical protein
LSGVFREWQPRYADHGVATFPVSGKVPAVRNYLRIGKQASAQFAMRFPEIDAFGFACAKNRITVLDVDAPDERLLADALSRHGPTPVIVRSGSGNFQGYYRHNGEGRRIRPDPNKPIDILGGGYVVAPPSIGSKGAYTFIQGGLDDLETLPVMRHVDASTAPLEAPPTPLPERATQKVVTGKRNDSLWRYAMTVAPRCCGDIKMLLEDVMTFNETATYEPLPPEEVLSIVASAFKYELEGRNWIGHGAGGGAVPMTRDEIKSLASSSPDAFALLSILRGNHGAREFALAKAFADNLGWTLPRFKAAREVLVTLDRMVCVRPGGRGPHDPPIYRLT